MFYKSKLIAIQLMLFLFFNKGYNQSYTTHQPLYNFKNFQISEAKWQPNFIYDLHQDEAGFLWMATLQGLYRYDGYQFKSFVAAPYSKQGISGNTPVKILADPQGGFWVATRSSGLILSGEGMDYYNPLNNSFTNYRFDERHHNAKENIIYSFLWEEGSTFFWVGTHNGLFQFYPNKRAHIRHQISADPLSNSIRCLQVDADNQLWLGTQKGVFHLKEGVFQPIIKELATYSITNLLFLSKEEVLIGTTEGLFKFHIQKKILQTIPLFEAITTTIDQSLVTRYAKNIKALLLDKDKKGVWIGSSMGLFYLNLLTNDLKSYHSYIQQNGTYIINRVNTLLLDKIGNLWIGKGNGLSLGFSLTNKIEKYELKNPAILALIKKNHPKRFYLDGSPQSTNCQVKSFFSDHPDYDWVGTSMGLYQFHKKEKIYFRDHPIFEQIPAISKYNITSFLKDSKGDYWIGINNLTTHSLEEVQYTLYYYQSATKKIVTFSNDSATHKIPLRAIKSLVEDTNGDIWIACSKGLAKYHRQLNKVSIYKHHPSDPNSISSDFIRLAFLDRTNQIWIGTNDNGLNVYRPETDNFLQFHSIFKDSMSLSNNRINTLCHLSDGWIWVGTELGLNRIHPITFEIQRVPFQYDQRIKNLIECQEGQLWINTYGDLYSYDLETQNSRVFALEEGIAKDLFINNTSLKNNQGDLLFGSISGMYLVPAEQHFTDSCSRSLTFTGLLTQRQAVKDTTLLQSFHHHHQLQLPFDKNIIEVQFSALDYTTSGRKEFRYKLEGYLEDWQYIGSANKIELLNLPYGRYILKIEGSNATGNFVTQSKPLTITIHPPWYLTWWAKMIYAGCLVFMIRLLYSFQLNRQLSKAATQKLVELNELKTKLYTDITHECRSPLTVIQGMASQIKSRNYKKETQLIIQNSQQLLSLINKILDLSKLESKNMPLHIQQQDVIPLIKSVVESFQYLAQSKDIFVEVNHSFSALIMDFDAEKLQAIISNLLSNAIKHTPASGTIKIIVEKKDKEENSFLNIKIADSGAGIPTRDLPYIFDRYYQSKQVNYKDKGTGIGLALTKELTQLLGGQIKVKSKVGDGTTFSVWLPITNIAPTLCSSSPQKFSNDLLLSDGATALEMAGSAKAISLTILVVEDHGDVATYLTTILSTHFEVIVAVDGKEGLDKAQTHIPDIIISDVMMSKMDGIAFCRAVKAFPTTSHIPIILLTAKVGLDNKIEGLQSGADAYLYKPFDQRELLAQIDQLIQQRKKLQAVYTQQFAKLTPSTTAIKNEFLQRVQHLILEYIDHDAINRKLEEELIMGRVQVYRKIKALTNLSTSQFINRIKTEKAYSLLTNSSLTISEIAYEVGFQDPSYFSKSFKKQYGFAPKAFRDSLKESEKSKYNNN